MEIRIVVTPNNKASILSSIFAYRHFMRLKRRYPNTMIRGFYVGGNSLLSPTADITEIFSHGLPSGFADPKGIWIPDKISGHVVLFTCYSVDFSNELLRRGAKSVLSFDDELVFYPLLLPFLAPHWDKLIINIVEHGVERAHAEFMYDIEHDPIARRMMHNVKSTVPLSNLQKQISMFS